MSQLVKISNRREALREMDYAHGLRVAEDPGMHGEEQALGDLTQHHTIAADESNRIIYGHWITAHNGDPAFEVRTLYPLPSSSHSSAGLFAFDVGTLL